jgi:hypothetical protein
VERDIDPEISREFYASVAGLPPDYRTSEYYGRMLRRLLANVVPDVHAAVTEFVSEHFRTTGPNSAIVGVHIRRSEHPWAVCPYAQPLRYYEAVMASFSTETRFFISTDSQEAFRWLETRFGGRVFQRPKLHDNRNSVAGVREGLVDMLLLSKCKAIVGTHGSSFSGQAALAGSRPTLMVKTVPEIPPDWPSFSRWRWLWAYRHFLLESTVWYRCFIWVLRPQAARIPRIPARVARLLRRHA